MRLRKSDWIFFLVAGGVIGGLVVLSLIGRKPKPIAPIPEHAAVVESTTRLECLTCHDPTAEGATSPLPASHPHVWKKEQVACTTCHLVPKQPTETAAGRSRMAAPGQESPSSRSAP